jgi:polyhydroxybutyrate depolymerase
MTAAKREHARRPYLALRRIAILIVLGLAAVGTLLAWAWALINQADGWIVSGGERRSFLLHVPERYDPATPVPLVVSLHGFAEWPAHLRAISRWNDLADQHGFIVVYPAGTGFPRRWRAGGWGSTGDLRDVTFIADLLDHLAARYSIDPHRIYVNGFSNGGGMTALLACRLADRIAAAGSVAGAYAHPLDACATARAVPFIAFHGTADPIVPYTGGPAGPSAVRLPDVPDWIAGWAARSGCDPTPRPLPVRNAASGIRYSSGRNGAEVVFYTIAGGGHAWPGSRPLPRFIVGHTTQDINATEELWAFFSQHPIRAIP